MTLAQFFALFTRRGNTAAHTAPAEIAAIAYIAPEHVKGSGVSLTHPTIKEDLMVGADPAEAIIAEFEGFREKPYLCPGGVWTIGYGTTRYGDGRPVWSGADPISEPDARRLLRVDIRRASDAVDVLVNVPVTREQHAALTSLVFNIGRRAFSASTLLMRLNQGKCHAAAGEFLRWNKGGGKVLPGLVRRRAAESALFLRGTA